MYVTYILIHRVRVQPNRLQDFDFVVCAGGDDSTVNFGPRDAVDGPLVMFRYREHVAPFGILARLEGDRRGIGPCWCVSLPEAQRAVVAY